MFRQKHLSRIGNASTEPVYGDYDAFHRVPHPAEPRKEPEGKGHVFYFDQESCELFHMTIAWLHEDTWFVIQGNTREEEGWEDSNGCDENCGYRIIHEERPENQTEGLPQDSSQNHEAEIETKSDQVSRLVIHAIGYQDVNRREYELEGDGCCRLIVQKIV